MPLEPFSQSTKVLSPSPQVSNPQAEYSKPGAEPATEFPSESELEFLPEPDTSPELDTPELNKAPPQPEATQGASSLQVVPKLAAQQKARKPKGPPQSLISYFQMSKGQFSKEAPRSNTESKKTATPPIQLSLVRNQLPATKHQLEPLVYPPPAKETAIHTPSQRTDGPGAASGSAVDLATNETVNIALERRARHEVIESPNQTVVASASSQEILTETTTIKLEQVNRSTLSKIELRIPSKAPTSDAEPMAYDKKEPGGAETAQQYVKSHLAIVPLANKPIEESATTPPVQQAKKPMPRMKLFNSKPNSSSLFVR